MIDATSPPRSEQCLARRIAELEAENARLERQRRRYAELIERDPATGLYHRGHFDARIEHEWARARRYWTPLSLILIGPADTAELVASRGSAATERALAALGRQLATICRDVDVCCRVAPDGFAVILPATNRTAAECELARLREGLAERSGELEPCFGMAVAFDQAETPAELVALADEALLLDKQRYADDDTPTLPHLTSPTWIDAA